MVELLEDLALEQLPEHLTAAARERRAQAARDRAERDAAERLGERDNAQAEDPAASYPADDVPPGDDVAAVAGDTGGKNAPRPGLRHRPLGAPRAHGHTQAFALSNMPLMRGALDVRTLAGR